MPMMDLNKEYRDAKLVQEFRRVAIDDWGNRKLDNQFFSALLDNLVGDRDGYDDELKPLLTTIDDLVQLVPQSGVDNKYHNPMHTACVVLATAYLCQQHGVEDYDYLVAIIAALGHDLYHPGIGNPADDPAFNERVSAREVTKLMQENGCSDDAIEVVTAIIISTSPNGPHLFVKNDTSGVGAENEQKILLGNPHLTELTKIVCDADILLGAIDMDFSTMIAKKLDDEARDAGCNMRVSNDKARLYFLDNIVGKGGFASQIAQKLANPNFHQLRAQTIDRLGVAKKSAVFAAS